MVDEPGASLLDSVVIYWKEWNGVEKRTAAVEIDSENSFRTVSCNCLSLLEPLVGSSGRECVIAMFPDGYELPVKGRCYEMRLYK